MTARRLTLALTVLVLLAGALTAWLATRPEPANVVPKVDEDGSYVVGSLPRDGDEVVRAAAEALPLALTYDFRTLDEGLAEATARMTPGFAEEFREVFEKAAAELARTERAVTQTLVRGAGLVEQDGSSATALVYVDQLLVSSKSRTDKNAPVTVSQNRVVVELRRVDGVWKVSGIRPF